MALIQLNDVSKSYWRGSLPVPVLHHITLGLASGEYVALMGASGSGKSTLMNILGCLDRPTEGEYWFDGREISHASRDERASIRNQSLGFIFQSFQLLPRMSAVENVMMPLLYSRRGAEAKGVSRKRAEELLARVGLQDRMLHEPAQLSGGQQQRVAIARALINQPKVLFADEPTGNLDSTTTKEVLDMFEELHQEGITIILVTHDPDVGSRAKRVLRMKDGRII